MHTNKQTNQFYLFTCLLLRRGYVEEIGGEKEENENFIKSRQSNTRGSSLQTNKYKNAAAKLTATAAAAAQLSRLKLFATNLISRLSDKIDQVKLCSQCKCACVCVCVCVSECECVCACVSACECV